MVYARFSRTRKGSGTYGRKRTITRRRRSSGFKKVSRPRFATVGFARNVEKKYFDKTYQSNVAATLTGQTSNPRNNRGVTFISSTWGDYSFSGGVSNASVISNDMLKGVLTGTTARSRIGNKVRVKYVKGAFTFNAACIDAAVLRPQGGESFARPATAGNKSDYLRTGWRFVIVKDLQVNSTDTQVTWAQVFDTTGLQAGVHSELNVDNMGRFMVLEDKIFTLDSDTPQKTCQFQISGASIGNVRYNGAGSDALTDKGLYVVWAAFVMGYEGTIDNVVLPSPVGHSRLCFTDD